jgi:putative membrane protein
MTPTAMVSWWGGHLDSQQSPAAGGSMAVPECIAAVLMLAVSAGYLVGARRLRRRGDPWPPMRDTSFVLGGTAVLAALSVKPPLGEFTAHMAEHLLLGMAAPLLFGLGRPLTLALRALPIGEMRRLLLAAVHSRAAAVLAFPPVAGLLDVGGLWVLYRTRIFADTHEQPWLHAAVHTHVLIAGFLFTSAVCQLEPVNRRYSLAFRGACLVAAGAAHAALAKSLYAVPPPGTRFPVTDVAAGAQLMYYGGDVVEVAIALVVALQWYGAGGRVLAR